MADPTIGGAEGSLYGVKMASLIAGFAGGVVSLSYLRELSNPQMFLAVLVGALTAGYITPLALYYTSFPESLENGAAFLIGLTSMNLIPGFINLASRFRTNPEMLLRKPRKEEEK